MKKAAATRMEILHKAFELVYVHGYQVTSVDDIIAETKVTKGAFYYHFKNKDEMGLAVINEVMLPTMTEALVAPLRTSADPATDIYAMIQHLLLEHPLLQAQYGCPAGNLTQEMSPLNEEFNKALRQLTELWDEAVQQCISNGKKAGKIRKTIQARQVASFVMSGYWGVRILGKLGNSEEQYRIFLKELKQYLKGLQ